MSSRHTVWLRWKIAMKTKPRNTFKNGVVLFSCVCFWKQRNAFLQYLNAQLICLCLLWWLPNTNSTADIFLGKSDIAFSGLPFLAVLQNIKSHFQLLWHRAVYKASFHTIVHSFLHSLSIVTLILSSWVKTLEWLWRRILIKRHLQIYPGFIFNLTHSL